MKVLAFCACALALAVVIRLSNLSSAAGFLLYCAGCASLILTGWFDTPRSTQKEDKP